MKYKLGFVALFVTMLLFGGASLSFAAAGDLTVTATVDLASNVTPGDSVHVVQAFTVTADAAGGNTLATIVLNGSVGGGTDMAAAEITRVAIYNDVNGNGSFDAKDTLVMQKDAGADINAFLGAGLSFNIPDVVMAANATKMYLAIISVAKVVDDANSIDCSVDVTATAAGAMTGLAGGVDDPVEVKASHFVFSNLNMRVATGAEILPAAATVLSAVDDYGNLDKDYVGEIQIAAENYETGADISGTLTATANAAGALNIAAGAAGHLTFAAGIIPSATAGAAGALFSLKSTTPGAVTLVAKASDGDGNADEYGLEGSTTVWNDALPATAPVVDVSRGIEIYDTDHNGHIDHMTVFFNGPVEVNGASIANFSVGSGYSLTGNVVTRFDAGGVGIRNAGVCGITVTLVEKSDVYDTNIKPDLTYNASDKIRVLNEGGASVFANAFGSASAVKVDKARPVLISAVTKDSGIGTGVANNGILDGLILTFSEPVRNVTAGPTIVGGATGYVGLAIPVNFGMSFNQGNGSMNANVLTLPISEGVINTGVVPTITYSENNGASLITDYATSATGANVYNNFYAKTYSYGLVSSIATTDGAPMVVHSVETLDQGGTAGRIDHIRVTFSEETAATATTADGVDFYSSIAAFATGVNANGVYTPSAVVGAGTKILTFTVGEVTSAGVYDTEATPAFRYDPNVAGACIADNAGNMLGAYGPGGLSHAATIDKAAPVIVKFITGDAYSDTTYAAPTAFQAEGPNGRIDNIKVVFSEKVKSDEGAQFGLAALDHAIAQFAIVHPDGGARAKMTKDAVVGKPAWSDKDSNGDTSTEIVIPFAEVPMNTANMVNHGDTGIIPTLAYAASGTSTYNVKDYAADPNKLVDLPATAAPLGLDGAKPFVVNGSNYGALAFANVLTKDTPVDTAPAGSAFTNNLDGDGYIDAYILKFSEAIAVVGGGNSKAFTVDLPGDGTLSFDGGTSVAAAGGILTVTGANDKKSGPDTAVAPLISYNADNQGIADVSAQANKAVSFTDRVAFDAAPPVIVGVNGDLTAANKLNFTFSEPVYAHDSDGKNISFNAASVASSTLFGYSNLGAGPGSSGFTAAAVTQPSAKVLQATMNANLTVVDIQSDLVWVRAASIFDDANSVNAYYNDNVVLSDVAGANLTFWIMDDVVAPWITNASTVDFDLDGKIDHIRFTFSEAIQDQTIKGFVSDNAMSEDVSATWKLSGYTGPARWNFFDGTTDAGKAAAIAAGKPAFSDNAKNNNVLYLELDEELVPVNANSGIGSTGFKPTVTWGTGAAAETMGDFRPNVLNTAKNPDDNAAPYKATNGTVLDKTGPAIVGATISGKTIRVLFSEPVKDATKAYKTDDFKVNGGNQASIWGITWVNNSTVDITMKSDFDFGTGAATTVEVSNGTNFASLNDALDNDPGLTGDVFTIWDHTANANAGGYVAVNSLWKGDGSPIAAAGPYPVNAYARTAYTITNKAWIANNGTTAGPVAAGSAVAVKWNFANIDQVELYQSFNNGVTYELVPGSQVAASAKTTTWTAKMGVTNIKVQTVNGGPSFSAAITVVYNGSNVGSSIGAPAALKVYDVPADNGGFVYAQFTKSADHLTAVKSYQFYREVTVVDTTKAYVLWATVAAGIPDSDGKLTVIIPTIWNDNSNWKVAASTGTVISNATVSEKAAADAIPVAEVVYNNGAAKAAAGEGQNISALTDAAAGAAIDNIAPSALSTVTAADNAGAGTGVLVSWVAPADHGIVGSYMLNGVTGYIYGVDSYDVYRKAAGDQNYVLAGSAVSGSTSFVDNVADGAAIYSYLVKAVDSAHSVETVVPGKVMAGNGTSDFNADGSVSLGDLVLLGNMWNLKSTSPDFIANFDLNKDGQIGLGDLVLLGNTWGASTKVAKAAGEVPMSNIAFNMASSVSEGNKMYYVSINTKDAASINGVSFSLKYDAAKFQFVSDSVTGLGDIPMVKTDQAGIIDVASLYQSEKFNGTITLGFKALDAKSDMNVEMVNAEVALNGVVNSVKNAETVMLKALPQTYALSQNFPNPFNPTTTIEYSIPTSGNVSLVIYNVAGQKVRTLVNGTQAANFYKVVWDGKNDNGMTVGTGTYFYKLVSGNYSKIVKMTLMK